MIAKLRLGLLAVVLCFAAVSVGGVQAAAGPESSSKVCKVVKHGKKTLKKCRTNKPKEAVQPATLPPIIISESCAVWRQPRFVPC